MDNFKEISRTLTVALCVVLTVCLVCTSLMFIFGVKSDIYSPPNSIEDEEKEFDPTLKSTHDYGDIYLNHMIIFCDSTLASISKFNLLKDSSITITGKSGDMPLDFNSSSAETNKTTADGAARSITDIVSDSAPQYLLISIGLKNGVEHCSQEKFKHYYQKLIDSVRSASPDTKIILQSILPVSQSVSKNTPALSIDKIDRANEWIYDLCLSNSLRYLNAAEVLKDEKGYLKSEYDSGDGIHLNEQGYKVFIEYVKTHGYK